MDLMVDISIEEDFSLRSLNTLGLSVTARYFVEVFSLDELMSAIAFSTRKNLELLILGGGSNLVFTGDFSGLVVKIGITGISYQQNQVTAFAGESWHGLVLDSLDHNLYGLENLSLIPGTVGAAPIQNIGAYGVEFADRFVCLTAVERQSGELVTLAKNDCAFGYRDSTFRGVNKEKFIIVSVTLDLLTKFAPQIDYESLRSRVDALEEELSAKQLSKIVCSIRREKLPSPEETGNVGSFFKNPLVKNSQYKKIKSSFPDVKSVDQGSLGFKLSAAWLIESSGLKGLQVGGAAISTRHALVIVNNGHASSADVQNLYLSVIKSVRDRFGVELEVEPLIR